MATPKMTPSRPLRSTAADVSTDTTKMFAANGDLIQQTRVIASADGYAVTTRLDQDGDDIFERITEKQITVDGYQGGKPSP